VIRIEIKPLSVNEVWQGKRFKTPKYKGYEKHVLMILRPLEVRGERLSLLLRFGLSSKNADIDNPVKPFLDILQKKYGFNDRQIYRLTVEKEDVSKGQEYIEFTFSEFI
jgi:Holliday junction resolvase RusA-like endonuclease